MPDENVHHMWSDQKLDDVLATLHADVAASTDARARVRAKLMLAANAGTALEKTQATTTTTRTRRAMPLAAAAAAVAVVAAGTILIVNAASQQSAPATIPPPPSSTTLVRPPATTDSQHAPLPPTPGQSKNTLGGLASRIPDAPLAAGQYRYVNMHSWVDLREPGNSGATYTYLAEARVEIWIPADQRQQWMWRAQTTGNRQWVRGTEQAARADGVDLERRKAVRPDGEERARCGGFVPDRGKQPCDENPPGTVQTANGPVRPPTDPRELYEWLAKDSATHSDPPLQFLRTALRMLHAEHSADLRRATLQALSYHPYLTVADTTTRDGRTAISVSIDFGEGNAREQVLLDPANGQLIGWGMVLLKDVDGGRADETLGDTVVHQAVVGKLGDKPAN